jgi:uncharacterized damage-inducible protein DinB
MVRLEAVLHSWRTVRADAAQAVEEFPADQLDFRATDDLMSFRQLALHILNAGNGLIGLLLDGEDNFSTPAFRDKLKQYGSGLGEQSSAAEIASALRASWDGWEAKLAAAPAELWSAMMTRMDGQQVTKLEMLQYAKEHEITHRSQMFVYLRLKGVVPPTTRRRMAKK